MQIDTLAVRLRPRSAMEAADLGVRLQQHVARSVYTCFLAVAVPTMVVAMATWEIRAWLPMWILWIAKPWLDQTVLFVLSRAAFGQETTLRDLWNARRHVLVRQLLFTLTIRRLSPWRALTQPVYQLEGFSIRKAGARIRQIRRRTMGAAFLVTHAFAMAEMGLMFALLSLMYWFAPAGTFPSVAELLTGAYAGAIQAALALAYAVTILFLEPFYTAAGFAMYLNRRAELEAWDIEQEFRRAFAA
jgi:hypothetical protein